MPFEPDIVVIEGSPAAFLLAVAVRSRAEDVSATEAQLKRYMSGMGCPTGLLVTPAGMRIYRDSFVSHSPDSIGQVGSDLPLPPELITGSQSARPSEFESAVQDWLEELKHRFWRQHEPEMAPLLRAHIIPALAGPTIILAGHPRWERTGTD
jgi:hypothetical protein